MNGTTGESIPFWRVRFTLPAAASKPVETRIENDCNTPKPKVEYRGFTVSTALSLYFVVDRVVVAEVPVDSCRSLVEPRTPLQFNFGFESEGEALEFLRTAGVRHPNRPTPQQGWNPLVLSDAYGGLEKWLAQHGGRPIEGA